MALISQPAIGQMPSQNCVILLWAGVMHYSMLCTVLMGQFSQMSKV